MDMLPMSTLSEEERQNLYLANVVQENAERDKHEMSNFRIRTHERLERDGTLYK